MPGLVSLLPTCGRAKNKAQEKNPLLLKAQQKTKKKKKKTPKNPKNHNEKKAKTSLFQESRGYTGKKSDTGDCCKKGVKKNAFCDLKKKTVGKRQFAIQGDTSEKLKKHTYLDKKGGPVGE